MKKQTIDDIEIWSTYEKKSHLWAKLMAFLSAALFAAVFAMHLSNLFR